MARETTRRAYWLPPELVEALYVETTGVKSTSARAPQRASHSTSTRVAGAIALLLAMDDAKLNRMCELVGQNFTSAARKGLRKEAIEHIANLEIAEWVQSLPRSKKTKLRQQMK